MPNTEVVEEIEVLKAIYDEEDIDEFEVSGSDTPGVRIRVALTPPENPENLEDPVFTESPLLLLEFTYPDNYPEVDPEVDIMFDSDSPSTAGLTLPDDKPTIIEKVKEMAEVSRGMQMTFSLVDAAREAAEDLVAAYAKKLNEGIYAERRQEEEKEMEKFKGEKVTRERFLEWQKKFTAEQEELRKKLLEQQEEEELKKRGSSAPKEKKLTGKQLFERGLAGSVEEQEDLEDDEGITEKTAALKV